MRMLQRTTMAAVLVVLTATAVSAASYSDTVLSTDGLVVYYRMNTDPAEIGDSLINEASPGTLDGLWGYEDGNPDTLTILLVQFAILFEGEQRHVQGLLVGRTGATGRCPVTQQALDAGAVAVIYDPADAAGPRLPRGVGSPRV